MGRSYAGGASNTGAVTTAWTSGFSAGTAWTLAYWYLRLSSASPDFDLAFMIPGGTENCFEAFDLGFGMNRHQIYNGVSAGTGGAWGIPLQSADVWHHYCWARDPSSDSNDPTCRVDGSPVTLTKDTNPSSPTWDTHSGAALIGSDGSAGTQIGGYVAHPAIYNAVLSTANQNALAAGDSPLRYANLVRYWPLQGNLGEYPNAQASLSGTGQPTVIADGRCAQLLPLRANRFRRAA